MQKKTVLIIDDELDMRIFMAKLMEVNGYNAITAKNGREGRQKAREAQPDLLIMDIMMPQEGGARAYHAIKADRTLAAIPVIILSAVSEPSFAHYLAILNASHPCAILKPDVYIEKPPDPDAVLEAVKKLIGPPVS